MELARIVFGIRLFNLDQGRGGEGLENLNEDSEKICETLENILTSEVEFCTNLCNKYQFAIVRALKHNRQLKLEEKETAAMTVKKSVDFKEASQSKGSTSNMSKQHRVSDYLLDRWSQELSNRRQYLGFLRSLQEDILMGHQKISTLRQSIQSELELLRSLVGNRASVPKEQVYPKFDGLASMWLALWEEILTVKARGETLKVLSTFKDSFNMTLTESMLMNLQDTLPATGSDVVGTRGSNNVAGSNRYVAERKGQAGGSATVGGERKKDWTDVIEAIDSDDDISLEQQTSSGAVLMSIADTPDFMQLPLELQGYCPWTIVNCNGLLVPGKPAIGVIRYENLYYVCDHLTAARAFMDRPAEYLKNIRDRVVANPEYIHLLRLQASFPGASIARLLDRQDFDQRVGGKPMTRDAGTETPTHFIEKRIDPDYHWNEWELRRKALQIANLKKCVTIGQQTDNSHFRRDNTSQVFLPQDNFSQTRRDKGTNPPIKISYVAGLRGTIAPNANAVSKYVAPDKTSRNKAQVVTLTLDL